MKSSTKAADLPHSPAAASMLCAEDASQIKTHEGSGVMMESADLPPPHIHSSSETLRFEEETT